MTMIFFKRRITYTVHAVSFKIQIFYITVKTLTITLFKHCPFLSGHAGEVDKILDNWKSYKMSVPTYGAILLDPEMKYVRC